MTRLATSAAAGIVLCTKVPPPYPRTELQPGMTHLAGRPASLPPRHVQSDPATWVRQFATISETLNVLSAAGATGTVHVGGARTPN